MDFRFVFAGLFVGIVTGLTGVGGSALLAPILILLLGVKANIAIGTDLAYSVPMKALAAFSHLRQGTVDGRVVRFLAIGGVPGAVVGIAAFVVLRASVAESQVEATLRHIIAVVILLAAFASIVAQFWRPSLEGRAVASDRARAVAIGALVGFLVALTSIGSGSITLPLLMIVFPAAALRSLIGAEIVFAAIMVPVAAAGHVALANVDWRVAGLLTVGALPGAYIGSRLCAIIGERTLRPVVACVLCVAGFKLL